MQCPFIKETKVRFCGASPHRKILQETAIHEEDQRCSSLSYLQCPVAQEHLTDQTRDAQCPFLQESLAQYCASAPLMKFIPHSDAVTRCNCSAHNYCHLYRERAYPDPRAHCPLLEEEIPVPEGRGYAHNHMWFDVGENRCVHIGVDGFLARVLGEVEEITFVPGPGHRRPTVILSVGGVDLPLTFPRRLEVTGTNVVLRARPETMLTDPYGSGWLFAVHDSQPDVAWTDEGGWPPGMRQGIVDKGESPGELRYGDAALQWMRAETDRMSQWVHDLSEQQQSAGELVTTDGGGFCHGLARTLARDELHGLWNQFFDH